MKINIDIDEELMAAALTVDGVSTKQEAVDRALRLMVKLECQGRVRELRGRVRWAGDLNEMRQNRMLGY